MSPARGRGDNLSALLPRLSQIKARGARVVFDSRLETIASRVAGVTSWTVADCNAAHDYQQIGRILIAHAAETLAIDIDLQHYPVLRILASASGEKSFRLSILSALLAPLTASLTAAGAGTWRVLALSTNESDDSLPDTFAAQLSMTFQGRQHDVRLHASLSVLAFIERRIGELCSFDEMRAPRITIPGSIIIGSRRISIAALEMLRSGDIVLRTMPSHAETALRECRPFTVRAAWGTNGLTRLACKAEISDGHLAIIEDPIMTDELKPLDDLPLHSSSHDNPVDIGAVDLLVQFEIESVALPLAQLSSLRPGYVIELQMPVAEAKIRLVAHGQTIGYGELISVAEHLGILIVELAHGDGPVR